MDQTAQVLTPQPVYPPPAQAVPFEVPQSASGLDEFEAGPVPATNGLVPGPPMDDFDAATGDDLSFQPPRVRRSATAMRHSGQIRQVRGDYVPLQAVPKVRPAPTTDDDLPVFYLDR